METNTDRKQVIHEIIAGMGIDAKMRVFRDYLHMNVDHMTEVQIDFMFEISRDQDVQDSLNANESCDCDKCQTILKNGDPTGPSGGVQRDKIYVDEIDNRYPFSYALYKFGDKVITRDGRVVSKIERDKSLIISPLTAYGSNGELIGNFTMNGFYNPDQSPHHSDLFCVKFNEDGSHRANFNRKPSTLPFSWQLYQVFDYKVVTRDGHQVSKIEKNDYENSYPLSAYCDKGKLIGTYTMDGHFRADKLDHSGDLFCVNK